MTSTTPVVAVRLQPLLLSTLLTALTSLGCAESADDASHEAATSQVASSLSTGGKGDHDHKGDHDKGDHDRRGRGDRDRGKGGHGDRDPDHDDRDPDHDDRDPDHDEDELDHETPDYPWDKKDCDAVFEFRAHAGGPKQDTPYKVAPGAQVYPQFLIDPPWGKDTYRAVAFHPLIDNEDVTGRLSIFADGTLVSAWVRGRKYDPRPLNESGWISESKIRLEASYFNQGREVESDRSGFALCAERVDVPE